MAQPPNSSEKPSKQCQRSRGIPRLLYWTRGVHQIKTPRRAKNKRPLFPKSPVDWDDKLARHRPWQSAAPRRQSTAHLCGKSRWLHAIAPIGRPIVHKLPNRFCSPGQSHPFHRHFHRPILSRVFSVSGFQFADLSHQSHLLQFAESARVVPGYYPIVLAAHPRYSTSGFHLRTELR